MQMRLCVQRKSHGYMLLLALVLAVCIAIVWLYPPATERLGLEDYKDLEAKSGYVIHTSYNGTSKPAIQPIQATTFIDSFVNKTAEWTSLRMRLEHSYPKISHYLPSSGFNKTIKNPCWWQHEPYDTEFSKSKLFMRYVIQYSSAEIKQLVLQPEGSRLYCLPYFFILGMAKSGTTDLYRRMMLHPQIVSVPGQLKEPHFWNSDASTTFLDYIYFFSLAAKVIRDASQSGIRMVTGDATGTTMSDFRITGFRNTHSLIVPQQIYAVLPNVKLIAIIRNPIQRFYSDYVYFQCTRQLNMQRTKIEFEPSCSPDHLHKHASRLVYKFKMCLANSSIDVCVHRSNQGLDRLIRGLYYPLLVPWTKTFALNKQLLVIRMEQYTSQIADVLRGVFVFLDLELPTNEVMQQILNKTVQNQGDKLMKEKTGPMLLETRKLLGEFYAPYNRQLAKLLNDEAYLWND